MAVLEQGFKPVELVFLFPDY
jgi:hypothetical protein